MQGNTEALHDPGGDHFIERLLTEWVAAFYKHRLPFMIFQRFSGFRPRCCRGGEI